MTRTDVKATLENGNVDVGVFTQGARVEVRDHDFQGIANRGQLRTDDNGKECNLYFVSSDGQRTVLAGGNREAIPSTSCASLTGATRAISALNARRREI